MNNNTLGGITVNESLQVLTEDGTVIPGLYAAGECVAVWGRWLSGGTGVNGAITFGRLAGQYIMEAGPMAEGYVAEPAANIFDESLWEKQAVTLGDDSLLENANDGTYTATVDGQEGPLTLEVVIESGSTRDLVVVEEHETPTIGGRALEELPGMIVESNSTEVDAISGATLTSMRVVNAVLACLEQAQAE